VPLLWAGLLLFHPSGDGTSMYALLLFAVFYITWEALQGIAIGVLIHNVNGMDRPSVVKVLSRRSSASRIMRVFLQPPR
jgi:hypothetical protein